jgi:quinol monooxygenase YgiN
LSNIVIGIRLFNRDIGKGGVGLESFNEIINHPARSLIQELNNEVAEIMEQSDKYTMYFNVIHDLDNPGSHHMIELYKDELTYKR